MARAVIFGTGSLAEVVDFYLDVDSEWEVAGFASTTVQDDSTTFRGRPVVPFAEVARRFAPGEYSMFVAVGYRKLNAIRREVCERARSMGYPLLSYISSKASHWGGTRIGDNVLVLEDNTIQPFVEIGDGAILWSGNHVGHHSRIGNYAFVSSHVVISGHVSIGDMTFCGVNSTVADSVAVGPRNLIGPGALIQKDTQPDQAFFAEKPRPFSKPSSFFFR